MRDDLLVPFSYRYGLRSHLKAWGDDHFIARHSGTGYAAWGNCERREILRCICPGGNARARKRCCDRASGEDMLCDACRDHCHGVTPGGTLVAFVEVYGSARGEHCDSGAAL